jgi:hypothetical protein
MKSRLLGAVCAVLSTISFNAKAVVIDFERITTSITTETYSIRTFHGFDVFVPHGHYEDSSYRELSGTDYLIVDHFSTMVNLGFDLSANNGNAFSLHSIEVSEWTGYGSTILTVTGQIIGGGNISTTFTTDSLFGFETLAFGSGWNNLSSVNFTDYTYDNDSSFGLLTFDNIVINAVPISAALWLWPAGSARYIQKKESSVVVKAVSAETAASVAVFVRRCMSRFGRKCSFRNG